MALVALVLVVHGGPAVASPPDDPGTLVNSLEETVFDLEAQHPPDSKSYGSLLSRSRQLRGENAQRPELVARLLAVDLTLHRVYAKWDVFLSELVRAAEAIANPDALGLELLNVPTAVEAEARFSSLGIASVRAERAGIALLAMDVLVRRFPATETASDALWASYVVLRTTDAERATAILRTLTQPSYSGFEAGKRAVVFLWSSTNLRTDAELPTATWDTDGRSKFSTREMKGKPSVLFFWTSDCAPCKSTMELLRTAAERYQGKVLFVGLNYDVNFEGFATAVKLYKPPGKQVHMPSQPESQRFPAAEFPQVVVLNRLGQIHRILTDRGQLQQTLAALTE